MAKFIVSFITSFLQFTAILFLVGGGLVGFAYSSDKPELMIIAIPLGIVAGFIIATIVLGIPLIILRINQNLEEINTTLKALYPEDID